MVTRNVFSNTIAFAQLKEFAQKCEEPQNRTKAWLITFSAVTLSHHPLLPIQRRNWGIAADSCMSSTHGSLRRQDRAGAKWGKRKKMMCPNTWENTDRDSTSQYGSGLLQNAPFSEAERGLRSKVLHWTSFPQQQELGHNSVKKERTELDSVILWTCCVSSFDYLVTLKIPQKTYQPDIALVPLIIKGT